MPGGFQGFDFGGGMPGGGGGGTRTFHFSTGGNGGGNPFAFSNPESIFAEFMRGSSGLGREDEDPDINAFFARGGGGMPRGSGGRTRTRNNFASSGDPFSSGAREATPDVTTVERALPLSLEEIYTGTTKKMKIKRKTFDETGKRTTTDQVLEVPIKPGLKKGSKIKFKGVGDQEEGGKQDLHFIVEEVSYLSSQSEKI